MNLFDFALVTGMKEEFDELRKHLPPLVPISDNPSEIWYRTTMSSKDNTKRYSVIIGYQSQMGGLEAALLTEAVIKKWQPSYIILTGIAGSLHESVKLGHIIVAQQVFYYDMGKAAAENKIQYRPQGYPCSVTLIRQAELISSGKFNWLQEAVKSAKSKAKKLKKKDPEKNAPVIDALNAHQPRVHFGTVASGSLVIASKEKKDELRSLHGKIIGCEMEGAGVMHAAFYRETPTNAIVVKSISDNADEQKTQTDDQGTWRQMALENSSRFVAELITSNYFRALNTGLFELNPASQGPGPARDKIQQRVTPGMGSFLSFEQLVMLHGPAVSLTIGISASGAAGALNILQGVAIYTDKDQNIHKVPFTDNHVELNGGLYPKRVGLYLMIAGTASEIKFKVSTWSMEKQISWKSNK